MKRVRLPVHDEEAGRGCFEITRRHAVSETSIRRNTCPLQTRLFALEKAVTRVGGHQPIGGCPGDQRLTHFTIWIGR